MEIKAWLCPACGRGVAPGVKTCDHGKGEPLDLKGREFAPAIPWLPRDLTPIDPWAPGRTMITD